MCVPACVRVCGGDGCILTILLEEMIDGKHWCFLKGCDFQFICDYQDCGSVSIGIFLEDLILTLVCFIIKPFLHFNTNS